MGSVYEVTIGGEWKQIVNIKVDSLLLLGNEAHDQQMNIQQTGGNAFGVHLGACRLLRHGKIPKRGRVETCMQ